MISLWYHGPWSIYATCGFCVVHFFCTPTRINNGSALCSLSITFHYVIDIHSLYLTIVDSNGVDYCQIFPISWKCAQANGTDSTAITGFFSVQTFGFFFYLSENVTNRRGLFTIWHVSYGIHDLITFIFYFIFLDLIFFFSTSKRLLW